MTARSVVTGTLVTALGALGAGGCWWGLLNVPESTVPALMLSALLAFVSVAILAMTTGLVLAVAGGLPVGKAVQRAAAGTGGFCVGLLMLGALWWATTSIDGLWDLHRGEIDALFLRYAGTAGTAWLHTGVSWLLWLVRWSGGLAALGAATSGAVGGSGALRGLGRALEPVSLGATLLALVVGRALWGAVYWRPAGLPTDRAELAFVAAKLGLLLLSGALLSVLALHTFVRVQRLSND